MPCRGGHTDRQEGGLGSALEGSGHTDRQEGGPGVPCRGVEHAKASGEMGQGEERQSRSRGRLDDSEALFWFSYFKT